MEEYTTPILLMSFSFVFVMCRIFWNDGLSDFLYDFYIKTRKKKVK